MSQENVDVFRKLADALNLGGVEALLELCPKDVVWYPFPDAPESADGFHGHDGIREVVGGWTDSFGEFTGSVRGSDVPVRQPMGMIAWDFRGGRLGPARSRFFPSWEEAPRSSGAARVGGVAGERRGGEAFTDA